MQRHSGRKPGARLRLLIFLALVKSEVVVDGDDDVILTDLNKNAQLACLQ